MRLVEERAFRWYELQDGQFVEQTADADGLLNSKVFPGLRLAVASLLSGDMATVLAELQEALKTDIHQKFATALAQQLNP